VEEMLMKYLLWEYPKCSTCQKAKKYLGEKKIVFVSRDIKVDNPSSMEIKEIINKYKLDIDKLFNKSGLVYRDLNLKDKLKTMSDDAKLELLGSNGMLIKRPILMGEEIYIGFNEEKWKSVL